jgi:hypothetical protein
MKRILSILLLAVVVCFTAAGCEKHNPQKTTAPKSSETATLPATSPVAEQIPIGVNLIGGKYFSETEEENLNKFFDAFATFNPLKDITDEKAVLAFGVWGFQDGTGEFSIPEEKVEQRLSEYFGVEKVNHKNVGDNGWDIPSYKNGFYNSGGGVGWVRDDWYNVSDLRLNGDGTYTAEVSKYQAMTVTWSNDGYVGENAINTFLSTIYKNISQWKLPDEIKIKAGYSDAADSEYAVYKTSTETVVLKQVINNAEKTWQIVSINGYAIPKTLY